MASPKKPDLSATSVTRRRFLSLLPAVPAAHVARPAASQQAATSPGTIAEATLAEAEKLAAITLTSDERQQLREGAAHNIERYHALRTLDLPNDVPPAFAFEPELTGRSATAIARPRRPPQTSADPPPAVGPDLEQLAFLPIATLAKLIERRAVSSTDLTRMYLRRLKRHDAELQCVITLCEELALRQAARADAEISAGRYRGPLHGIPWGAKDILAVKEYRTTWGAAPYASQVIPYDATVVERLAAAGAVLLAKLSLGETARGDVWFGGRTRNPWNLEQGASGSSAGPAAATAAGLVGFSIGSDTRGSIVLPADRCGATGFRPTFGTVSRHGAMVLAWTMDKLGPICRSVEDCALVHDAIRGPDGHDVTVREAAFDWPPRASVRSLRVAYLQDAFDRSYPTRDLDRRALDAIRSLAGELRPITMFEFPLQALRLIMDVETAAAFDELTRSNQDDLLTDQSAGARPNNLRHARFIPAVEYVQAQRARTLMMRQMARLLEGIDVFVAPSLHDMVLMLTNLTGHPCAVVPNGLAADGSPASISFVGNLFKDAETLMVAHAYQRATGFHLRHPPRFTPGPTAVR